MPHPNSNPNPQPARKPFAPAPGFSTLQQYIHAAATSFRAPSAPSVSGSAVAAFSDLSALYHLVVAIFTAARAAVRCLAEHYQARPHALTPDLRARLQYCALRLKAIFYTLGHAPHRFLSASQFRALYRAQAVLAHIWNQPVTFDPLIPWLTAPENCPAPARGCPPIQPASSSPDLCTSRSALRASSDPLLLNSPGRALASVLRHLAAIYGVDPNPVAVPSQSAAPNSDNSQSLSPHSALHAPRFPHAVPSQSAAPNSDNSQSSSTQSVSPQSSSTHSLSPHSALHAPRFPHAPP